MSSKLVKLAHEAELTGDKVALIEGFIKDTKEETKKVDLHIFKRYAPHLIAFARGEDCNLSSWCEYVGGHYKPADIIENGKVVAHVPAILRKIPTYRKKGVESLNQASLRYEQLFAINPVAAVRMFDKAIEDNYVPTPTDHNRTKAWRSLLEFCGVDLPPEPAGDLNNVSGQSDDTESPTELLGDEDYDLL